MSKGEIKLIFYGQDGGKILGHCFFDALKWKRAWTTAIAMLMMIQLLLAAAAYEWSSREEKELLIATRTTVMTTNESDKKHRRGRFLGLSAPKALQRANMYKKSPLLVFSKGTKTAAALGKSGQRLVRKSRSGLAVVHDTGFQPF